MKFDDRSECVASLLDDAMPGLQTHFEFIRERNFAILETITNPIPIWKLPDLMLASKERRLELHSMN